MNNIYLFDQISYHCLIGTWCVIR